MRLLCCDLLYNPRRAASWRGLAGLYRDAVSSLWLEGVTWLAPGQWGQRPELASLQVTRLAGVLFRPWPVAVDDRRCTCCCT